MVNKMIIYQKPKMDFEYKLGKYCCSDLFKEIGGVSFHFDPSNGDITMLSGRLGPDKKMWVKINFCPFCGERISILKIDKNTEQTLKELKVLK